MKSRREQPCISLCALRLYAMPLCKPGNLTFPLAICWFLAVHATLTSREMQLMQRFASWFAACLLCVSAGFFDLFSVFSILFNCFVLFLQVPHFVRRPIGRLHRFCQAWPLCLLHVEFLLRLLPTPVRVLSVARCLQVDKNSKNDCCDKFKTKKRIQEI